MKMYINNKFTYNTIMTETSKTTIIMPVELKKDLKKIAIDEDTSLSGLILKMINEAVEARQKEENKVNNYENNF